MSLWWARRVVSPLVWDDTQVSVSGTTETEKKNFRFFKIGHSTVYVRLTAWVSGGTGYVKVYVDSESSARLTLSTTSTSETKLESYFSIADLADGVHTIRLKLSNSGSYVTYQQLLEVYAI